MNKPVKAGLAAALSVVLVTGVAGTAVTAAPAANSSTTAESVVKKNPFIPSAVAKKKMKGPDLRVAATTVDDDTVRLVSNRPATVKMRLVKTGVKGEKQVDNHTVRVTPKGVNVDGLLSGRTYRVILPGGKFARITPMERVESVGGVKARFGETERQVVVNAEHVPAWAAGGDKNVQYRWTVTPYEPADVKKGKQPQGRAAKRVVSTMVTDSPEATVIVPASGYVQVDAVAVNPLGATVGTFYSTAPVEDAWKSAGPGGVIAFSATPPSAADEAASPADIGEMSAGEYADYVDSALGNANAFANEAAGKALDAKRAAGAALDALNAGDPVAAQAAANDAHEAAGLAAGAAVSACTWKDQIPGDTFREQRLEAETACVRADVAADEAAYAAAQASVYAVAAWKDRAVAKMVELRDSNATVTGQDAIDYAERLAGESRTASANAGREAGRINAELYPAFADQAALDVSEAGDAASTAGALSAMVDARSQSVWAGTTATSVAQAQEYATAARTAATAASAAAAAVTSDSSYAVTASAAAEQARAYADEADAALADVTHRVAAQQQAVIAAENLTSAQGTATAAEAVPFLVAARAAADAAEAEAALVRAESDEKAAADQAASEARASAGAVEPFVVASQELLNEAITIQGVSAALGGDTNLTLVKNPNDTRGALGYDVTANGASGTLVDNGDGTLTASWSGLSDGGGYTFTVTPTTYRDERVSQSPTTYTPAADAQLSVRMVENSSTEVCGETPSTPGTLVGSDCVDTLPLAYDTAPYEYATTPYTYYTRNFTYTHTMTVGATHNGTNWTWNCPYGYTAGGGQWGVGVCKNFNAQGEERVKNAPPSGYQDLGNGVYTSITPKAPADASWTPRIDSAFSDTSFIDDGSQYVAVSPLPASDFDTADYSYAYDAGRDAYATVNPALVVTTYRPELDGVSSTLLGWFVKDGPGGYLTTTVGPDTGRYAPVIVLRTLGGDVEVTPSI